MGSCNMDFLLSGFLLSQILMQHTQKISRRGWLCNAPVGNL